MEHKLLTLHEVLFSFYDCYEYYYGFYSITTYTPNSMYERDSFTAKYNHISSHQRQFPFFHTAFYNLCLPFSSYFHPNAFYYWAELN